MRIILAAFLLAIIVAVSLYRVGEKRDAQFMLNVITAIGVLSAVTMAVYGDRIKRRFNRIRLTINKPEQSDNFFNDADAPGGGRTKVFCHHLRVKNSMPTQAVKNCRVWLVKILDEDGRGGFEEKFKFAVPRLMAWAPREYSPEARSFSEDQVFDLGRSFVEQGGRFEVSPYGQGGMFKGGCLPREKRQYVFKITADNYIKAGLIAVEVHVERCEPTPDTPHGTRTQVEVKSSSRRFDR
jgi:hypothetical protein